MRSPWLGTSSRLFSKAHRVSLNTQSTPRCRRHYMQTCWTQQPPQPLPLSPAHQSNTRSRKKTKLQLQLQLKRKHPMVPEAAQYHKGSLILNSTQPLSVSSLPSSALSLFRSRNPGQIRTPPWRRSLLPYLLPLSQLVPSFRNGTSLNNKTLMSSMSITSFRKSRKPVSKRNARARDPKRPRCISRISTGLLPTMSRMPSPRLVQSYASMLGSTPTPSSMPATSGRKRFIPSDVLAPLHQCVTSLDLLPMSRTRTCRLRKNSPSLPIFLPLLSLRSLRHRLLLLLLQLPTLLHLHLTNIHLHLHLHHHNSWPLLLYLVCNTIRRLHLTLFRLRHLRSHIKLHLRLSQPSLPQHSHQEPSHVSLYATSKLLEHKKIQTMLRKTTLQNRHKNASPKSELPLQDKKVLHSATWRKWVGKRAKVSAKKPLVSQQSCVTKPRNGSARPIQKEVVGHNPLPWVALSEAKRQKPTRLLMRAKLSVRLPDSKACSKTWILTRPLKRTISCKGLVRSWSNMVVPSVSSSIALREGCLSSLLAR